MATSVRIRATAPATVHASWTHLCSDLESLIDQSPLIPTKRANARGAEFSRPATYRPFHAPDGPALFRAVGPLVRFCDQLLAGASCCCAPGANGLDYPCNEGRVSSALSVQI